MQKRGQGLLGKGDNDLDDGTDSSKTTGEEEKRTT